MATPVPCVFVLNRARTRPVVGAVERGRRALHRVRCPPGWGLATPSPREPPLAVCRPPSSKGGSLGAGGTPASGAAHGDITSLLAPSPLSSLSPLRPLPSHSVPHGSRFAPPSGHSGPAGRDPPLVASDATAAPFDLDGQLEQALQAGVAEQGRWGWKTNDWRRTAILGAVQDWDTVLCTPNYHPVMTRPPPS